MANDVTREALRSALRELLDVTTSHFHMPARMAAATKQASAALAAPAAPFDWRELARRLYVELFHCDQQMCSTRDEDGDPIWTTGATVRDVLRDANAALKAAPAVQAAPQVGEDAASQVEHLDVENHRLRRAMQKIMARLADLLDEDQFGNIESIVTEAGVEPPEHAAQAAPAVPQISDAIFLGCARLGMAGASDEEVMRFVRVAIGRTTQGESHE
ncbi:hypothetical protein WKR98_13485 [Pigmentiphaga sp. YJ18]|uniref:hypothetical protein n=1 Tax=Pigmentiphaga sp. YJ18 TaxID=3134907 RepID=UPI0031115EDE